MITLRHAVKALQSGSNKFKRVALDHAWPERQTTSQRSMTCHFSSSTSSLRYRRASHKHASHRHASHRCASRRHLAGVHLAGMHLRPGRHMLISPLLLALLLVPLLIVSLVPLVVLLFVLLVVLVVGSMLQTPYKARSRN